jgi:hypothetical protein
MSARHWSDRWLNEVELADAVAALDINGLAQPVSALRGLRNFELQHLAELCDAHGETMARAGRYEVFVVLTDAAAALRDMEADAIETEASTVETGTFRALRSECIAGVAVTEYEGDDTARYVAIGHGQSDQPPELVRVWAADPDDVDTDDDGTPL